MSLLDGLFGGGSKTSKTTTSTSYPDWVTGPQEATLNAAWGMAAPFLQPSQYALAGQTADQQQAANLARQSALGAFNTDWSNRIAGAGTGYTPTTVSGADIQQNMNPFIQGVINPALATMGRQRDAQDAAIGARNASGVAFGGSGPALERAQLNRGFGEQVADTTSNLLNAGYSQAAGLAGANADRLNAAGASNASLGLQSLLGAANQSNNQFDNQQTALGTLLNIGNQNQAFNQAGLDIGKNTVNWLNSLYPPVAGATTQSTPQYTSPLSGVLGLAALGKTAGFY